MNLVAVPSGIQCVNRILNLCDFCKLVPLAQLELGNERKVRSSHPSALPRTRVVVIAIEQPALRQQYWTRIRERADFQKSKRHPVLHVQLSLIREALDLHNSSLKLGT